VQNSRQIATTSQSTLSFHKLDALSAAKPMSHSSKGQSAADADVEMFTEMMPCQCNDLCEL